MGVHLPRERRKKNSISGWLVVRSLRATYDWRKPNRLLTLQIGDAVDEQVVVPEYWAPDGKCDKMISALKLVTHLTKGNKLGVVVQGFTESNKNTLAGPGSRSLRWTIQER